MACAHRKVGRQPTRVRTSVVKKYKRFLLPVSQQRRNSRGYERSYVRGQSAKIIQTPDDRKRVSPWKDWRRFGGGGDGGTVERDRAIVEDVRHLIRVISIPRNSGEVAFEEEWGIDGFVRCLLPPLRWLRKTKTIKMKWRMSEARVNFPRFTGKEGEGLNLLPRSELKKLIPFEGKLHTVNLFLIRKRPFSNFKESVHRSFLPFFFFSFLRLWKIYPGIHTRALPVLKGL